MNQALAVVMKTVRRIHFIGIGGISMPSLAAITKEQGREVSGSDRSESPLTRRMAEAGITVYYGHAAEQLGDAEIVVYTAAVHEENPEMAEAARRGLPRFSLPEMGISFLPMCKLLPTTFDRRERIEPVSRTRQAH